MRRWTLRLVLVGLACVAAALALKAVMPGPKGQVELEAGDSVELEGGAILVLKDFRVPKYPSGRPRQFESDVHIVGAGEPVHATVSVNHPLRWNGHWIYQSSYDAETERQTVLTVFRDPWLGLAAVGGALLLLGAFLGCFTIDGREPAQELPAFRRGVFAFAALAVFAVPLTIVLRAVLKAEPMPALQSPLMAPHVAAYAASYLIMIFAAFGLGKRYLPIGFFLMTLGLVLGAVWGKVCWSDFWQYDPKEMWSFFAWLTYVAWFACRDSARAERVLRIVGAVLVVLTATWVNFSRLFPGLHNYAG